MKIRLSKKAIQIRLKQEWSGPNLRKNQKYNLQMRNLVQLAGPNTSISHTQKIGGFATCRTSPVGFDIEDQNRPISEKAFRRLTMVQERSLALSPIEFWVAKEAAWKALRGHKQPQVITSIRILSVRKIGRRKHFTYSTKYSHINHLHAVGRGVILNSQRMIMGIALPLSQL